MCIDCTANINDVYTLIFVLLNCYYNTSLGTQTLEFESQTEFNLWKDRTVEITHTHDSIGIRPSTPKK